MNPALEVHSTATTRPRLGIYSPSSSERNVGRWRINGHPAAIVIWTVEEWDRLEVRPVDAQYFECGVWCALRLV